MKECCTGVELRKLPTPIITECLRPWSVITDLSTLILGTHYGLGFIVIWVISFTRLVTLLLCFTFVVII